MLVNVCYTLKKRTVYDKINFTDVECFNDIEFKHVKDALPKGAQIVGWCRDDNDNDCEEALHKTIKVVSFIERYGITPTAKEHSIERSIT